MSIWGVIGAGLKIAKKGKERKIQKAQDKANLKEARARGAVLVNRQHGETQSQASGFAGKGIAGGPAAAAQVANRQFQQRAELDSAQRDIRMAKKVKKSNKMDITSFF